MQLAVALRTGKKQSFAHRRDSVIYTRTIMMPTRFLLMLLIFISVAAALHTINKHEKIINFSLGHPRIGSSRVNKPENLTVLTVNSSTLNATWHFPSEGSIPDYYRLIWNGETLNEDVISFDTFYVISKLNPCSTYSVSVYSVKDDSQSDEVRGTGSTDKTAPPEPKNLTLSPRSSTEVKVKWETPSSECIIDQFSLDWEWQSLWEEEGGFGDYNTTSLSYTISDLIPYSNVTVCVLGITEQYYGPQACDSTTTLEDEPGAPILQSGTSGYGSSEVKWEPPIILNGVITSYKLFWKGNSTEGNREVGDVLEYILPLPPCESYDLTVAAKTISWGSPSNATEVTILNNETPSVVHCTHEEDAWKVEWESKYTCPVDNYEVSWEYQVIWSQVTGSNKTLLGGVVYEFDGEATANTKYNVCVSALTSSGESGGTSCCQLQTEEGVPSKPIVKEVTNGKVAQQIHVSWTPPEERNGVIISYRISWKSATNIEGNTTKDGTVLEADIDLGTCETYTVTVAAATSKGYGNESDPKSASIENFVPAGQVNCVSGTDRTVKISWTTGLSNCPVTGFRIDYNWTSLWSSHHESTSKTVGPESLEYTVSGVPPYTKLYSCVGVGNMLDDGACCNKITDQEVPGPPQDLQCNVSEDTSAYISWAPPVDINGILSNWLITWSGKDSQLHESLTPDARSYTMTDLSRSTTYSVILQASTGAGPGSNATCIFTTAAAEIGRLNIATLIVMLVIVLVLNK